MDFPIDVLLDIFEYLDDYKQLVNLTTSSKSILSAIKSHNWYIPVKINKIEDIDYILNNYKFLNIDLSSCYKQITDANVEKLGNCHTLNLTNCKQITDKSVEKLGNCHTLDLRDCNQITDKSVEKLGNCHTLNLAGCHEITDKSDEKLGNCHTLCLAYCNQITDKSVEKLGNCHTLYLWSCDQITDKSVNKLKENGHIVYR